MPPFHHDLLFRSFKSKVIRSSGPMQDHDMP
jgi:hypothetical protein